MNDRHVQATPHYIYADVADTAVRGRVTARMADDRSSSSVVSWAWWVGPVLALLAVQIYIAFREPIFSPVDELQHTDYVRTIAEDGHLPIFGQSRVDPTLLAVYMHEYPGPFSATGYVLPDFLYLGYEAVQFPVYYLVAAPLYKLFDRDPRVAIYALRIENVLFSAALLALMMLTLRTVFPTRPDVTALPSLAFLLMPGVSVRHTQVTNQVLAALLFAVLLLLLVRTRERNLGRWAFVEGALFGVAILTKITVAGAGLSVIAAWTTRPEWFRRNLLPGAAGFIVGIAPWLAWSLATYHSPLPWTATHLNVSFCDCSMPKTAAVWNSFLHAAWVNFVLPFEWAGSSGACTPQCYAIAPRTGLMRAGLVIAGVLTLATVAWAFFALRNPRSSAWRPALIAFLAVVGASAGIVAFDLSLDRFWSTDLRETYVFAAPIALLLGGAASVFNRRLVLVLLGAVLLLWLAIDYQMFTSPAGCLGCPPWYFKVP